MIHTTGVALQCVFCATWEKIQNCNTALSTLLKKCIPERYVQLKHVGKSCFIDDRRLPKILQEWVFNFLKISKLCKWHLKSVDHVLVVRWLSHMSSDFMKLAVTPKYKIFPYEWISTKSGDNYYWPAPTLKTALHNQFEGYRTFLNYILLNCVINAGF